MKTDSSLARFASIDILRGLVMVLMTLDHTRDFFSNAHFNPTDLQQTSPALFLTRWITHFCASVFIFLAGSSAYLWQSRRGTVAPIGAFLLKRGLLLIVLTTTVEAFAWNVHNDFRHISGGVLWAIGWSMIVMAGLVKLPLNWVIALGGLMIVGHNAFDSIKPEELAGFGWLWKVLHTGNLIELAEGWQLLPFYPLIPWIGVMAVGYGFGKWLNNNQLRTRQNLLALGLVFIAVFVLLRLTNLYGDPDPWQVFPDPVFTMLSFLNCHKYPPSLLYLLMTLGPALVVLALLEGGALKYLGFLQVFGRTPLFFYLLHLYMIRILVEVVAAVDSIPFKAQIGYGNLSPEVPASYGYGLPVVYLLWLLLLLLLYPICCGFETLKAKRPHWRWLNYL